MSEKIDEGESFSGELGPVGATNEDEPILLDLVGRTEPAPARLTQVSSIYHSVPGENPLQFSAKSSKFLTTDEQVYTRKLKVGSDWVALESGWLESASLLLITNEEGKHLQSTPSKEEAKAISQRVVELSYQPNGKDGWLIHPKSSFQGAPQNVKGLYLRCQEGTAKVIVHIFPK